MASQYFFNPPIKKYTDAFEKNEGKVFKKSAYIADTTVCVHSISTKLQAVHAFQHIPLDISTSLNHKEMVTKSFLSKDHKVPLKI